MNARTLCLLSQTQQKEADEEAYFEAFGLALVGEGDNVELVDLDELN